VDTLGARFKRNAPDVDARGDWALVYARMLKSSEKKPRRRLRLVLVSCAATCAVAVLIGGAMLALSHMGTNEFVVVVGDAPSVTGAASPTTSPPTTVVTTEFSVAAHTLSAVWLRASDVAGFDPAHAYSDQLEIDYGPDGELLRVYIHAYTPMGTDMGEITARYEGASDRIELAVTLTKSNAASEHGVASSPVASVLAAVDGVDAREMILFSDETISILTGVLPRDFYQRYRLTTVFDLTRREAIERSEPAYIWRPGSDISELSPEDDLRKPNPIYVHLAMTAYPRDVDYQSVSITDESLPHIFIVLRLPDDAIEASEAAFESTGSIGAAGAASDLQEIGAEVREDMINGIVIDPAEETSETPEKMTFSP
jgi:hypothetical protein